MSYRPLPKASVAPMRVVHRKPMGEPIKRPPVKPEKKKEKKDSFTWLRSGKTHFAERLTRNVAIAAAVLLCAVAIRNGALPQAQDVFSAVQQSVNMNLDETLGKLTFVSNLLPESALVFLNSNETIQVTAPVHGEIVHAWREAEPYVALLGVSSDVRAASGGQIMNVAHGDAEERIVRIRHDNGLETMYYNLEESYVAEGDKVFEGDIIGHTADKQPVYFELRRNGRSIDPTSLMKEVVTIP